MLFLHQNSEKHQTDQNCGVLELDQFLTCQKQQWAQHADVDSRAVAIQMSTWLILSSSKTWLVSIQTHFRITRPINYAAILREAKTQNAERCGIAFRPAGVRKGPFSGCSSLYSWWIMWNRCLLDYWSTKRQYWCSFVGRGPLSFCPTLKVLPCNLTCLPCSSHHVIFTWLFAMYSKVPWVLPVIYYHQYWLARCYANVHLHV